MQLHCVAFTGKYSERTLEQYSARVGATSNLFHFAVTADAVVPHRNQAIGSVIGGRRFKGYVVATFDNTSPDEAMKRVQVYLQSRN